MNVRGKHTLTAPRDSVFAGICDPDVLLGVIPGCREIEQTGDTEYRGLISLRLPGIVGTYRTVVRLVDSEAPNFGKLEGEVEGSLGTIKGHATFRLTESGSGTRIDYDGHAVIGGPLARLDNRFIEGLAGSLINQGLRNLDTRLRAESPAPVAIDRGQQTRETRA
jgi:carbon monoxide dehydrogenase subunit G